MRIFRPRLNMKGKNSSKSLVPYHHLHQQWWRKLNLVKRKRSQKRIMRHLMGKRNAKSDPRHPSPRLQMSGSHHCHQYPSQDGRIALHHRRQKILTNTFLLCLLRHSRFQDYEEKNQSLLLLFQELIESVLQVWVLTDLLSSRQDLHLTLGHHYVLGRDHHMSINQDHLYILHLDTDHQCTDHQRDHQ